MRNLLGGVVCLFRDHDDRIDISSHELDEDLPGFGPLRIGMARAICARCERVELLGVMTPSKP